MIVPEVPAHQPRTPGPKTRAVEQVAAVATADGFGSLFAEARPRLAVPLESGPERDADASPRAEGAPDESGAVRMGPETEAQILLTVGTGERDPARAADAAMGVAAVPASQNEAAAENEAMDGNSPEGAFLPPERAEADGVRRAGRFDALGGWPVTAEGSARRGSIPAVRDAAAGAAPRPLPTEGAPLPGQPDAGRDAAPAAASAAPPPPAAVAGSDAPAVLDPGADVASDRPAAERNEPGTPPAPGERAAGTPAQSREPQPLALAADARPVAASGADETGRPLPWRLVADLAPELRPPQAAGGPPPQPAPAAVLGQIAAAIDAGEGDRIEIRLDPPELGRVQIELRPGEKMLHALLLAERPEVQELVRRHLDLLERELAALGFEAVRLDLAGGRAEADPDRPRPSGQEGGAPAAALPGIDAPPSARDTGAPGRLDIRL